jgi:pyruvate, water dikinase
MKQLFKTKTFWYLAFLFLALDSFSQDYLDKIGDLPTFKKLAGEPLEAKYSNIKSIKVVVRSKNEEVYFINSTRYKLHFDFVSGYLHEFSDLEQFNACNYSDSKQRIYYLSNLNYAEFLNKYFIDFSAADKISVENIIKVQKIIQQKFACSDSIYVLLSNPKILGERGKLQENGIPVISPDEIYNNQKYQIISQGTACGKLLLYNSETENQLNDFSSNVLLVEGNTNDVPYCRGLIANKLQTPLSHICILSQQRHTPALAFKDIQNEPSLLFFLNKAVCMSVIADTFRFWSDNSIVDSSEKVNQNKKIVLKIDTLTKGIIDLENLSAKDIKTVGAKAANLAEINKINGFKAKIPEAGCAIPLYYYFQHIKKSGADKLIQLIDKPTLSYSEYISILEQIRERILRTEIDSSLINNVNKKLSASKAGRNFRFRSSSNAEDREFFSGAGLYESRSVILGDSTKTIEKAIKKVWASLWSVRAYEERKYRNIDMQTVGMGILIHRSFPNENANGVIITRNLYRNVAYGFVFNAQAGDVSVVLPKDSVQCDQFISYYNLGTTMFNKPYSTEYITYSSLNNDVPVLTDDEVRFLTRQAELIKKHFYYRWDNWKKLDYKDFALDIEFKIDRDIDGKFIAYIKQVRPF